MNLAKGVAEIYKKRQQFSVLKDVLLPGIFETFATGYMLIDVAGNIQYINSKAKEILGCDDNVTYTNARQLVHKKDFASAMRSFVHFMKEGDIKDYRFSLHRKNSTVKSVRIDAQIIYNMEGKRIGVHGTIVEVT